MNNLFIWVNSIRPDVIWIKGTDKNNCQWDTNLPNQQEIIDRIACFDNNWSPKTIPTVVTPRQLKTAIILSGKTLNEINNIINTLDEPKKTTIMIAWEYSLEFERNHPFINELAPLLGMSNEDIDDLFIQANKL